MIISTADEDFFSIIIILDVVWPNFIKSKSN